MPTLTIGQTEIDYEIRYSERARQRRIIVTPDRVEVVVPIDDSATDVQAFVRRRRRWIYDRCEEMREIVCGGELQSPKRLVTGAKIPYRGRAMKLQVNEVPDGDIRIEYRHGFIITRPVGVSDDAIERTLRAWLRQRALEDVRTFAARYARLLAVTPTAIRVRELKHHWGVCGLGGAIQLNWRLVFAPKPVLEYAVVHELCHLLHRNHSPAFWSALRRVMPDYELRKAWLERNERALEDVQLGE